MMRTTVMFTIALLTACGTPTFEADLVNIDRALEEAWFVDEERVQVSLEGDILSVGALSVVVERVDVVYLEPPDPNCRPLNDSERPEAERDFLLLPEGHAIDAVNAAGERLVSTGTACAR